MQYQAEDVDVAAIEFINNQPCVDLIEKGEALLRFSFWGCALFMCAFACVSVCVCVLCTKTDACAVHGGKIVLQASCPSWTT